MTPTRFITVYEFLEFVFDATIELAEELSGVGKVGVVSASYISGTINCNVFDSHALATQWISTQQDNDEYPTDYYIVGADVRV